MWQGLLFFGFWCLVAWLGKQWAEYEMRLVERPGANAERDVRDARDAPGFEVSTARMADTGVAAVARRVRVRDRGVCLRTNWLAVGQADQLLGRLRLLREQAPLYAEGVVNSMPYGSDVGKIEDTELVERPETEAACTQVQGPVAWLPVPWQRYLDAPRWVFL
ncbi:unnamed protein product [Durusdinium trenchii]|uniref:SURF1-like protein n=1 Tax=Durusdinium trenchii TaxID=1381693 RepID=A0ABP0IRY6_9DINO